MVQNRCGPPTSVPPLFFWTSRKTALPFSGVVMAVARDWFVRHAALLFAVLPPLLVLSAAGGLAKQAAQLTGEVNAYVAGVRAA